MRTTLIWVALVTSVAAFGQTEILPYAPGQSGDGVVYYLPKTGVEITVEAEKTTYTPGEYCKYAEKYLRLTGLSAVPTEEWTIQRVTITPIGVPDKEKAFIVRMKDKSIPVVSLTEAGIIQAYNATVAQPVAEVVAEEEAKPLLNPRDFMTEEMLLASSAAKTAELVAKEIYAIRESKNAITRGQADNMPKDGESLRIMLNSLETQEQALLQLFTGTTVKERQTVSVTQIPATDIQRAVVLRFSRKLGIVDADDLSGSPIYLTLTDLHTVKKATVEEKKKQKPEGLAYNVPSRAAISVDFGVKNLYKGEIIVSQFGEVEYLSNALFTKKGTTKVLFDPTTGALMKIE